MEGNSGMKKCFLLSLLILLAAILTACAEDSSLQEQSANGSPGTEYQASVYEKSAKDLENDTMQKNELKLKINGKEVDVQWTGEKAVSELAEYVRNGKITVNTSLYGGFEQVGSLPRSFSKNDVQMTARTGDIVLYSGNQMVLFFGKNSWSYTKLGHIQGLSDSEISELLGGNTAVIEIETE